MDHVAISIPPRCYYRRHLITLIFLFLLTHARSRNNQAGRRPPSPPTLIFIAKFLAQRRSIFDQAPLLRDLHEHYDPVISLRLTRTLLVFIADRCLTHRTLIQDVRRHLRRPHVVGRPSN
jgi:hypothetical protein